MWPHESPWFWWKVAGGAALVVVLAPLFWDKALVRWWQSGQPKALGTWAKRNGVAIILASVLFIWVVTDDRFARARDWLAAPCPDQ